ncbi:MAG: methionyl-tRNA formyltransferase [Burkholderiaceae bacterium]|nr:methionyl-tRNA formyltransferase [Burkholderiaceae bacterium]NDI26092.1 methionyl-tRNA formyltransferase [Burkholderiaceae bacterium]
MKIIFAGTPEFAATALAAVIAAGHEVVAVLTQPDRPAGRGLQLQESPVKRLARANHIPVLQPQSLHLQSKDLNRLEEAKHTLAALDRMDFEVMVVVAYGLILPEALLQLSKRSGRRGCFNIHASLLPRWRGAAPIQRAIEAGDTKTGVAIMEMEPGLDTGPVLIDEAIWIANNETAQSLHDRLAYLGGELIVKALKLIADNPKLILHPQDPNRVTYAHKILKAEAKLDWSNTAEQIDRKVRSLNPAPGASTELNGELVKVWLTRIPKAESNARNVKPGTILGQGEQGVLVQCGDRPLELLELQNAGGKKITGHQWFLGRPKDKTLCFS